MNAENFCYWLQSQFEFAKASGHEVSFNQEQILLIEDHLKLVFKKETLNRLYTSPNISGFGDQNLGTPQLVC